MLLAVEEKTFSQEVLKAKIPVLVSFWAPWCRLCRRIEPVLTELQANSNPSIKVVLINADANLQLTNQYRLTNIPSLLIFDQGKLIERIDRFHSTQEAEQLLQKALAQLVPSQVSVG
ncbi:MAG: thioredoxin family protein [Acaryochloridaceae cyanobacterium SU_2_1]|nr:thioredoxin family protein [Acaryochloridaceae cyanobacterium SU_2_1]NJM94970.1 thioredoxin family protein [Acaryochloridaceae cyanobacterium CSU_5_19]